MLGEQFRRLIEFAEALPRLRARIDADLRRHPSADAPGEIHVHSTVAPTRSFREGSGAVVEGRLGGSGVFEASQVIVKHDENYVAPSGSAVPSNYFDPGSDS